MTKLNCWEIKNCGREPNGARTNELGICPAAREERLDGIHSGKHAGRACWPVAGTFCGGTVQGSFATKLSNCLDCDCYKQVVKEEGLNLHTTKEITDSLHNKILTVGLPLLVKTTKDEDLLTYLIGWKANEYIIAQLPNISGKAIASKVTYSLKYIKDGDAYIFDSEAISVQTFPLAVVYFKYPRTINKISLRKNKRYQTRISSIIIGGNGESENTEAMITDLSESGCRLKTVAHSNREIKVTDSFSINFSFLDKTLDGLECTVKNISTLDGLHFIGMEFKTLPAEKNGVMAGHIDFFRNFQIASAPFL